MEHLLQDIPVQPPVAVPARTMQEAIAAKDLPPLDVDASEVIDMWEKGDGLQDNTFVKRKV